MAQAGDVLSFNKSASRRSLKYDWVDMGSILDEAWKEFPCSAIGGNVSLWFHLIHAGFQLCKLVSGGIWREYLGMIETPIVACILVAIHAGRRLLMLQA